MIPQEQVKKDELTSEVHRIQKQFVDEHKCLGRFSYGTGFKWLEGVEETYCTTKCIYRDNCMAMTNRDVVETIHLVRANPPASGAEIMARYKSNMLEGMADKARSSDGTQSI